jgi:hypothetical protein
VSKTANFFRDFNLIAPQRDVSRVAAPFSVNYFIGFIKKASKTAGLRPISYPLSLWHACTRRLLTGKYLRISWRDEPIRKAVA